MRCHSEGLQRPEGRPDPVGAAGHDLQMDLPVPNAATLCQGNAGGSLPGAGRDKGEESPAALALRPPGTAWSRPLCATW